MLLREVIDIAFEVLEWLIIARVLLSWFRLDPYHPIVRFIYETTEPILAPLRRMMPRGTMPLDFSPIVAILALYFIKAIILQLL